MDLPVSAYLPATINKYEVTPAKRAMADLIEKEFTAAGYDRPMVAAAIVNSWAESRLDPSLQFFGPKYAKTKKKTEDSVGLFMLNTMGGHGVGMPKGAEYPKGDSRFDPVLNIRRILEVMLRSRKFSIGAYVYNEDPVGLTGEFCKYIELPEDPEKKAQDRMALFSKVFPFGSSGPLESERDSLVVPEPESTGMSLASRLILWGLGLSFGGLIVTAMLRQHAIKTGRFVPPGPRRSDDAA